MAPPAAYAARRRVQVRVLNGTGIPRLAARTTRGLTRLGFDVTGTGDAAATSATTQTTVQSRNAGASICSGLPAANLSPGIP